MSPDPPEHTGNITADAALGTKDAVMARWHDTINQIRAVLAMDLRAFPAREGKKRFLASGSFAERCDTATIAALKRDLDQVAAKTVPAMLAELATDEPWRAGRAAQTKGRTLDGNQRLTSIFERIASQVRAVLTRHGFPEEHCDVHYKTPTWFIDGAYLPGLIEKYWRLLAEIDQIEEDDTRSRIEERRKSLAQRWEEA